MRLPLLFAAAASAAGCADEMTLQLVDTRVTPEPDLVGVDSDGFGGLWMAFRTPASDYYANASVRVVHVDEGGAELARFSYQDEYTQVNGLAFTGDALWLNYNQSSTDDNRIRKLDPATGLEVGSFATEVGIVDLAARDGMLLLSYLWDDVIALEPARGGQLWRSTISEFPEGGTQRGIAVNDEGIWLMEQERDVITLVADDGSVQATASLPGRAYSYDVVNDYLTWDGDRLLLAHNDKLLWFEVTK